MILSIFYNTCFVDQFLDRLLIIVYNKNKFFTRRSKAIHIPPVPFLQLFPGAVPFRQSGFDVRFAAHDLVIVVINVILRHGQADKSDGRQILIVEVVLPVSGYVPSLHDEILLILNDGFHHFPGRWATDNPSGAHRLPASGRCCRFESAPSSNDPWTYMGNYILQASFGPEGFFPVWDTPVIKIIMISPQPRNRFKKQEIRII